jgi:hypothetical protein
VDDLAAHESENKLEGVICCALAYTAPTSVESVSRKKPVIRLVFNACHRGDFALSQSRFVQDRRSDI